MQTFKIEKNDTQCVVTWRHYSYVYASLFLFILVAGPIFGLTTPVVDPWTTLLGVGLWFYALVASVNVFFGKTRLVLGVNGFQSTWTCLFLKREKHIQLDYIHRFAKIIKYRQTIGLKLEVFYRNMEDGPIISTPDSVFYTPAYEYDIDDLCTQLNAFLETLKQSGER